MERAVIGLHGVFLGITAIFQNFAYIRLARGARGARGARNACCAYERTG